MAETCPFAPEEVLTAIQLRYDPGVQEDIDAMVKNARLIQSDGLRIVASEAREKMAANDTQLSGNLAVLNDEIKWALTDVTANTRYYTEAISLGFGLAYACALLHFKERSVPLLPPGLAANYHPRINGSNPETTEERLTRLLKLSHLSELELERDSVFHGTEKSHEKHVPRPEHIGFFRFGAGYAKHLISAADAVQRLQSTHEELGELQRIYGQNLGGLSDGIKSSDFNK
jgi:hypothetical protein